MTPKVLLVYPNLPLMQLVPNSISILSAYLKSKGVEVELFDTTLYKTAKKSSDEIRVDLCQVKPFQAPKYKETNIVEDFVKHVKAFKPDLIGFNITSFTWKLTQMLLFGLPNEIKPHVVAGGPHVTLNKEKVLQYGKIDSICIGEGEEALFELVSCLVNKQDHTKIKNLWTKSPTDKKLIIKNDLRPPIDINSLPPDDFTIFEPERLLRPMQGKMLKMIPILTDRGCPYDCTYCSAPKMRGLYKDTKYTRLKSVDKIISELKYHIKTLQPDFIYFNSETFLARPKSHFNELVERYHKEVNLPFWCETRVETINEDTVKGLKKMHPDCWVTLGLESGNEDYRQKVLKKKFTNREFLSAVHLLEHYDIGITINNIVGLPDETLRMVFDTIKLNKQCLEHNGRITINVAMFVPFYGTELYDYCKEKNYIKLEPQNVFQGSFHTGEVYLQNQKMTEKQTKGIFRTFVFYVKLPKLYYPFIRLAENEWEKGVFKVLKDIYRKLELSSSQ